MLNIKKNKIGALKRNKAIYYIKIEEKVIKKNKIASYFKEII